MKKLIEAVERSKAKHFQKALYYLDELPPNCFSEKTVQALLSRIKELELDKDSEWEQMEVWVKPENGCICYAGSCKKTVCHKETWLRPKPLSKEEEMRKVMLEVADIIDNGGTIDCADLVERIRRAAR